MNIVQTPLDGVLIVEPKIFEDHRGFFTETWHRERYRQAGIDSAFVQDNMSFSARGVLRGLHYQIQHPQAKLVQVITGEIFDVAVDLRPGSPTFAKWTGVRLSGENHRQFYIPEGFAHGFCVLSEQAHFMYKCSDFYAPGDEGGILWSDPDIAIDWPVNDPVISPKDAALPALAACPREKLPL